MTVTVMDFYTDWCGPCTVQDAILEEVEANRDGDVEFERIDAEERQEIANEYQVRSFPTLVIENEEGIVEHFIGVTQSEKIEDALRKAGA